MIPMQNWQKKALIIGTGVVIITSAASLAGVAYLLSKQPVSTPKTTTLLTLATSTPFVAPQVSPAPSNTPMSSLAPSPTPQPTVVVYESENSYPAGDKTALTTRVVNPLLDYYQDEHANGGQELVSFTVSFNTGASKASYPYQGKAVFRAGTVNSFLISKTNMVIDWWLPECTQCNFSDAFKLKYPEIVSKFI